MIKKCEKFDNWRSICQNFPILNVFPIQATINLSNLVNAPFIKNRLDLSTVNTLCYTDKSEFLIPGTLVYNFMIQPCIYS